MSNEFIEAFKSVKDLKRLVEKYEPKRVFLVTGKDSYSSSGAKSAIEPQLKQSELYRHADFEPNPQYEDILKGAEKFNEFGPDMVIAVGGGSAIDTAKLISVLPPDAAAIKQILKGNRPVPERKVPFIAIPTTAGSGSEATHFAVCYLQRTKYSVKSAFLLPDHVVLDAELTYSLPFDITAATAFDAFTQAVESYWAVGATEESRKYAAESIERFKNVYDRLITSPEEKTREEMMKVAHLAGKAINISKTTACHAASYALTMHFGLPHGQAVILTLPEFFIYNAEATENKINKGLDLEGHLRRMSEICTLMDVPSPDAFAKKVRKMLEKARFPSDLFSSGLLRESDIDVLVDNINEERLKNNPVVITKKDLKRILLASWKGKLKKPEKK